MKNNLLNKRGYLMKLIQIRRQFICIYKMPLLFLNKPLKFNGIFIHNSWNSPIQLNIKFVLKQ
jgi:hypothetical protein